MADANATPPYHLQTLEHAARSRGVDFVAIKVAGSEGIVSAIDAATIPKVFSIVFLPG